MASLLLLQPRSPSPLQACMTINAWSLALCTVVLPLCILYHIERRERQRFSEEQGMVAPEAGGSPEAQTRAARPAPAASASLRRQSAAARDEALARAFASQPKAALPFTGLWPLDVYYYSCLIWCAAAAVYAAPG